jgi:tripartite-type tricarboxylate transporter receptor subunit TctC
MNKSRLWIRSIGAVAFFALSATPLLAGTWPQRTVRVIVPIGAGSGTDVAARLFADGLAERWKRAVVIDNRPGADGLIGVAAFAGMHDDHVLLYTFSAPLSVYPELQEKLPYDPVRDVVPISWAAANFLVVAAAESSKIGSLQELIARGRAEPGKLNYNGGAGLIPYLFAAFLKRNKADLVSISYRELNLALQDLAEGRIQVMLTGITPAWPLAQAGKVKLLAVTNPTRAPMAPGVPTAVEAGYPDLTYEGGTDFFGPRDMANDLRDRIAADIRAVAVSPVLAERLASIGQIARNSTPAEFTAALLHDRETMKSIVRSIGTKPTP